MRNLRLVCAFSLLALSEAHSGFSQAVHATLLGSVTDIGGGVVPSVKVTITETNTGVSHTGTANESGNYTFPDVPPGQYSISVEHPGFKKEVRQNITVTVNSNTRVDVQLSPGSVNETIEVTGAPALLQTDRADTGRTMEAIMVEELPLGVNRNFQSLLELVPGTTENTFQHSQFFNASSSLQNNVNGQARMGNNSQIEGIDNNERTGLLQILIPPAEAIQSVAVSTSNHDPELGRASGAVSNVILKSGTNAIHGMAYELIQNSAWDARSFFNPSVGHLAYNRVGGNLGGPIKKGKVFIFGDYLRTMDHEANTNQTTIPSMAYRTGDMSADTRHTIYDPETGAQDGSGTGRSPFPGNMIPANRINPAAAKILSFLPAPNEPFNELAPSNNYFVLLPAQKTSDQFDVKVDYNLNEKDRLSGRFSFSHPVTFQAPEFGNAGGPAQGAFAGTGFQKTYSTGLNYNRIVTPTVLTEVRLGVAHYHNEAQPSDYGIDDATNAGISGINISKFTSGMVGISIPNFSSPLVGYSASLPWIRAEANIDFANTWTKILRNHTIKFGADIRRIRDDLLQDQTFSPRGVFNFGGNQTSTPGAPGGSGIANDMASFLLGLPSSVGRDVNTYFPAMRAWQAFAYVADNWQVSPKFTVTLGLRWEFYPPATPAFPGGFSNYNFANNTLVIAGVGGNPMNLGMETRYKYFAPRVGLAYRLTRNTVIRSGFGMSYAPFPDNTYAYNFPVRANNQYSPIGNGWGPAVFPTTGVPITFQNGFPPPQPIVVPSSGIITNPDPTSTYTDIPLNYHNPSVLTWNFAVQQSLPWHLILDVAYVGTKGVDTAASVNLNAGAVVGGGASGQPQYPRTAASNLVFQGFSSTYNSLQVKLDRRFNRGLRMTTSFTFSKAMDFQGGDDGGLYFYINPQRSYARADFDRTFNYVQSYIYKLPFGKGQSLMPHGPAAAVFGGWQVTGILSLRSGLPFSITCGCGNLAEPGTNQTANQVAPVEYLHGINIGNPWFSTGSFETVSSRPTGTAGNTGRNIMNGPGLFGLNANVSRTINVTEKVKLDVRAEALNVTNTPQFSKPQNSFTSATFGMVTGTISSGTGVNGTGGGRNAQFGAKVIF